MCSFHSFSEVQVSLLTGCSQRALQAKLGAFFFPAPVPDRPVSWGEDHVAIGHRNL